MCLKSSTFFYMTFPNAGISVCANQNEKVNLGPVISSFGVRPLKNDKKPSFFAMLATILKLLSLFSKLRACILVLMTSIGADTMMDEDDPMIDATKF